MKVIPKILCAVLLALLWLSNSPNSSGWDDWTAEDLSSQAQEVYLPQLSPLPFISEDVLALVSPPSNEDFLDWLFHQDSLLPDCWSHSPPAPPPKPQW
ncbi:exported hypothetical protein [Candidatus Methylacidithermus pantelleriae]|uniref:Uncharacterized protein n=1 Tax=Candidatus Methylacidithermus pantelleriae TaxID=2744239 RepID=A0A8J2BNN6_9BACT|nr:exported hypothetical protein [Candidatus Methylacidithermus pantelleriae]